MKIKVNKDGKETDLELKGLKGRYIKKIVNHMIEIQGAKDDQQASLAKAYMDELDTVASEITGFTVEELDDLDIEDKNKIVGYIIEKTRESMGFGKSS